ncbi:uracil-DNA glycosylase [Candidatus Amesbacteria bacterium]|nr:uracil-DNA glycosylase [Candidatus Amesbacteria bacterium]MBI2587553.1 uracil-DNA glycosylase [Candidatus Amesbacteria bacterium]
MNTQQKTEELTKIAEEIKSFKGLEIAKNCTHAVPGEGDPDTQIMFIGESPGFNEDQQGRPFVGQAGQLLEKTLKEVLNLDRMDVYITNIVKFRPPDNRDPTPNEIAACRDWLDRQISTIRPKIICTLGRYSMAKFIPDVSISRVHGQPRFVEFLGQKYIIFPMYHPAAALRGTGVLNEFKQDFNKLKNLLNPVAPPQNIPEGKPVTMQPSLF